MAGRLGVKMVDFADNAWQTTRSDDDLRKVIVEGGLGLGLGTSMPPSPHLAGEPLVLEALVAQIRGLARAD